MEASLAPQQKLRKSRLYWQCRRGMLELDCLLQNFFNRHYDAMDPQQILAFEQLLACADDQLFDYLFGQLKPSQQEIANVVKSIRSCSFD